MPRDNMNFEPDPIPTPSSDDKDTHRKAILRAIYHLTLNDKDAAANPQTEHGANDASEMGMQEVDRSGNPIKKPKESK